MQVNTAITLLTLANSPIESEGSKVILYRRKEGNQCYLVAARERDLTLYQKILKFFRFHDFRLETVNSLLDEAAKDIDNLRCILRNLRGSERFSKWYFYVKQKMGGKLRDLAGKNEADQKTAEAFKLILSQAGLTQQQRIGLIPERLLPEGVARQEALSLHPTDPSRVRGIRNQGNWCFLDAFVQAANASSRFRELLQKRKKGAAAEIKKLSVDLARLESRKQKISKAFLDDEKSTIALAQKIGDLEEKITYNTTTLEHAALEERLRALKLPQRATLKSVKKAGALLQEMKVKNDKVLHMVQAKERIEALLCLFAKLNTPNKKGKLSTLCEKSALNRFVETFKSTGSSFSALLESHNQQDSSELLAQLGIEDLTAETTPLSEEEAGRERRDLSSPDPVSQDQHESLPDIKKLFIPGVDQPTKQEGCFIQIKPPALTPPQGFRLQDAFRGFEDFISVARNKQAIADNPRNKRFFGGDSGKELKERFLRADYRDIIVERRLSLSGEPPPSIPVQIGRYDDYGRKRAFSMDIPFRLEIPCKATSKVAVYLLRSAVIHSGSTPFSGHYYSYAPDLRSVDRLTNQPTRFVKLDDSFVSSVDASEAMRKMAKDGYLLFYDRVDSLA